MIKVYKSCTVAFALALSAFSVNAQMRITEYQYDGSEFIEFTNVGSTNIDMTGWKFSDNSRATSGTNATSLSAFGVVTAGESVILTDVTASSFRTTWNLCAGVKVIGGNAVNLGRSDEINLYDNTDALIDRLTYNDQGTAPLGGPRTNTKSAWVPATALGTNVHNQWVLSALADAEGSFTAASGGYIGSPGKSARATVYYNPCAPKMRITEYQYDGSEFIEFTNVGSVDIDMTGWKFSDNSRATSGVNATSLTAFGTVNAGESVVLTDVTASAFRTTWGLCPGVKVIGGNAVNLGRNDEINIYDNNDSLIDRLTYNDQGTAPLGGPRTNTKSAWVPAVAMGINVHNQWVLSAVADAETSFAATTGGFIGSPGKSARATVVYDPCALPSGGNPTIVMDTATTSNLIDGGVSTLPLTPFAISGVMNDATDPLSTVGINFTIGDDATAVNSLTVTAVSSNITVVPATNIILSGTGSSRNIKINPAAVGYADITVTVNDGTNNTIYVINYAASAAATDPANAVYHTGYSDASTAVALDDNYMIISDDEKNILNVYSRSQSGLPVKSFDYSTLLGLTDLSSGAPREIDLEASARSLTDNNKIYWLGSHSNKSTPSFDLRPNRNRIFATTVTGTGATTAFTFAGYYEGLRNAVSTWSNTNSLGLVASMTAGFDPKQIDGFNMEGMAFAPDNTTMYIGFRAPLEPTTNRVNALIAPIQNFETWFGTGTTTDPVIGTPILLDLGGKGIREITRISQNSFVIAAGDYGDDGLIASALYKWNGNPSDAPVLLSDFNVANFNPEGVLPVYSGGNLLTNQLEIINDNGTVNYYNDGTAAKDLSINTFKKFSSNKLITLGSPLPIVFQNFNATYAGKGIAALKWNVDNASNYSSFDVERSADGISFERIASVKTDNTTTSYTYNDKVCCVESYLYRIKAITKSGDNAYSAIKLVRLPDAAKAANIVHALNSDWLEITTLGNDNMKTLNVYNMNGQRIIGLNFADTEKSINISGIAQGMYLVEVIQDGNVTRKKIVK
ncbi:T9SS type A sorting domain-containing protein [Taibaiella lutea]|uniref:T9SS type A sorting domain-containing protein n=1 Tax=Taibaiella lutea TaxID=2608001 RepID=A0A5M6CHJ2_9BACT|nr:lamin tail domain-containing protein [Taibaiella lutea]KAA5534678.1 T9SS type A sorting domain-containing protein [Taibaiella lutea]